VSFIGVILRYRRGQAFFKTGSQIKPIKNQAAAAHTGKHLEV